MTRNRSRTGIGPRTEKSQVSGPGGVVSNIPRSGVIVAEAMIPRLTTRSQATNGRVSSACARRRHTRSPTMVKTTVAGMTHGSAA